MDPMKRVLSYIITEKDGGRTVREYLRCRGCSHGILASMKPDPGAILLNGAHVFLTRRLIPGDLLTLILREEESSVNIVPAAVPFSIIYEDEDLLVIDKPAGVSIHPAVNHPADTLANGIAWYFQQRGESYVFRCINRLDRDTTGLLLLAGHRLSAAVLEKQLWQREIHRTYLAVAEGVLPPEGTIDLPIGRKEGSIVERCADPENGDQAVTHFRTLSHFSNNGNILSAVLLRLDTGRTHQIRVHMQSIGHPLLGDTLYNPKGLPGMPRQALHSWRLSFRHPVSDRYQCFTAPVPDDLRQILPDEVLDTLSSLPDLF